jgi:hypothetical protein
MHSIEFPSMQHSLNPSSGTLICDKGALRSELKTFEQSNIFDERGSSMKMSHELKHDTPKELLGRLAKIPIAFAASFAIAVTVETNIHCGCIPRYGEESIFSILKRILPQVPL